ncbi:MAG: ABC transporter permease [Clostridia bacterium]|nr:ABC transporter permease [Clostridia bacterium]
MKIRHIVFSALSLLCLLIALCFMWMRHSVTAENFRDFAAETFAGSSETKYSQFAAYLGESDYLTPDGMMELKNTLESKMTENSIEYEGKYLLSGSCEKEVTILRDTLSVNAVATVYFGDYFGLHPEIPVSGGYLDESAATTDFCIIDDLAAWRLFGSTDVCGLDVRINEKLYTISAVLPADRSEYASYYGEKPRVYVLYSSAAMRDERVTFTSLEAVLPDIITDFAKTMFKETVSSYTDEIYTVTGRFAPANLFDNIKGITSLGVMEGKSFPYYENVARIMETKCALLLVFEMAFYILGTVFFATLLVLIFRPINENLKEKRAAKKRHAIY